METGDWLRVIICVGGVMFLGITLSSLAKRRMTEPFCLAWGIISIALIGRNTVASFHVESLYQLRRYALGAACGLRRDLYRVLCQY